MLTDADGNEIGKLFVGGLSQSTTDESLRVYFSMLGQVEDSVVMMDNKTGRSRGFGYVKYVNAEAVDLVLQTRPHIIDGKEVDVKQCNVNMKGRNRRSLKIFVGGISLDHDADSIKAFFSQFGKVSDVNLMMDQNKNRHRGFAFVGFEEESVVKKLISMHYVTINGKQVELKAMEPPNFAKKSSAESTRLPINVVENNCFSYDNTTYCSHNAAIWRPQISPLAYNPPVIWSGGQFCSPQWSSYDPQYWTGVNWTPPNPATSTVPPNTTGPPGAGPPPTSYYQQVPTSFWPPQQWQQIATQQPHLKHKWINEAPQTNWTNTQDVNPDKSPNKKQLNTSTTPANAATEDFPNWTIYPNTKHEFINSNVLMQLTNIPSDHQITSIPGSGEGDYSRNTSSNNTLQDNCFPYYATRN